MNRGLHPVADLNLGQSTPTPSRNYRSAVRIGPGDVFGHGGPPFGLKDHHVLGRIHRYDPSRRPAEISMAAVAASDKGDYLAKHQRHVLIRLAATLKMAMAEKLEFRSHELAGLGG